MKISIIPEKCIACGLCQVLAPATFDYTADGIVIFKNEEHFVKDIIIDDAENDAVTQAYKECPTRAIIIEKNK